METKRLKAVVYELTAILQEMQEEFNEYDSQKSEWYYSQLKQHYSGLSTNDEFINETQDRYSELHSHFYVGDTIRTISNLEKCCEYFKKNNDELQRLIAVAKNRVPADWKEWKVIYKDSQYACNQVQEFFAPTAEQAVEMCKKVYMLEHNTIEILEVKEVESMSCCKDCKHLKCMGYHYYECTNEASENNGQSMNRVDSCNQFEED